MIVSLYEEISVNFSTFLFTLYLLLLFSFIKLLNNFIILQVLNRNFQKYTLLVFVLLLNPTIVASVQHRET